MSYLVEKAWFTAAGLHACVIICQSGTKDERLGHRCGYVGVPVGHPFHGVGYAQQIPQITQELVDSATIGAKSPILVLTCAVGSDDEHNKVRRSLDVAAECHGGLTHSGGGDDYPIAGPEWWFGFDCAHAGDEDIEQDERWPSRDGEVRRLPYVVENCERLAQQIQELAGICGTCKGSGAVDAPFSSSDPSCSACDGEGSVA